MILSPTSFICHHHRVTNNTVAAESLQDTFIKHMICMIFSGMGIENLLNTFFHVPHTKKRTIKMYDKDVLLWYFFRKCFNGFLIGLKVFKIVGKWFG